MAKIIRPAYPKEFSVGLLLLIFALSSFLSIEIFDVSWRELRNGSSAIVGAFLAGFGVVIMSLILWEEFLFPVRIKPEEDEIIFRNHFTKLKTEVLIYLIIPVIGCFIFLEYKIHYVPFGIWVLICVLAPLRKLFSGIKNYNDFLKLTNDTIEYKDNEKEGVLRVSEITAIVLIKDESNVVHKLQVDMQNSKQIIIDLDEMELESYYQTIEQFVKGHYKTLVK
jgi:hypothetical protein